MITLQNYIEATKHIAWDTMPKEYQEGNDFTLEVLGNVAFQNDKEIRDVAEQYVQKLNGYDKFDDNKPVTQKAAEKKAAKKLTDLAAMAKKAAADGKQAPNYNLCEIEVPGTNIFCQDNKGIKRAKMPQLKGMPATGTQAEKDSKGGGEVDGEAAFKKYLQDQGKTLTDETVLAEDLKSTQNELVGVKVAGMTEALKKDPLNPGITAPIFISQDNYVLDGHHRWAAHVGLNLGNDKDVTMKVVRVNMPIKDLVKAANKFADEYGIKQKAATADKPKLYKIMDDFHEVSKDYARKHWKDEDVHGIREKEETERLIESEKDIDSFDVFGIPVLAPKVVGSMSHWKDEIIRKIRTKQGISQRDAEAIIDANSTELYAAWTKGLGADQALQKLTPTTKGKNVFDAYLKKRFARYSDQELVDLTNRLSAEDKNDDDQVAELVRRAKEGRFKLVPEYDTYRIEPISKPVTKAATKRKPKQWSASTPHKIKLQDFQNEVFIGLHDWIGKTNGGQSIQKSVASYNATTDPQNKTLVKQTIDDESADRHKLEVYQALAAGLKVPDDVVKQYPEYENLHKAATKRKPKQRRARKSNKRKAELNNALKAMVEKAKAGDYRKLNRVELLKVAQQFEKTRSKASQTRDESSSAKKRLTPNPENLVRWMNNPGAFDLIGIDTKDLTDPTADLKIRKEIFWRRLGIKMNSK